MSEQKQRAMCPLCGSAGDAEPGDVQRCSHTGMTVKMQPEPELVFRGVSHGPGPAAVYVRERGSTAEQLDARKDIANHSPSGFAWGYRGSGPAQLALAILAHVYDDETAAEHYQAFKDEMVATADGETFVLTGEEVEEWMGGRE